jgi:hypothetical protein
MIVILPAVRSSAVRREQAIAHRFADADERWNWRKRTRSRARTFLADHVPHVNHVRDAGSRHAAETMGAAKW